VHPRPLSELINTQEPALPLLREWIAQAVRPVEVLPPSPARADVLLRTYQHSPPLWTIEGQGPTARRFQYSLHEAWELQMYIREQLGPGASAADSPS
jgi:hypothetical protein